MNFFAIALAFLFQAAAPTLAKPYVQAFAEPISSVNPFKLTGISAYDLNVKMAEPLLRVDESGEYTPELAESYEISPDGKTYTFRLRKGVKWSDGEPLTAADVKFTIEAFRDPKFEGQIWAPLFAEVEKIEVVDKNTVRLSTKSAKYSIFRNVISYTRVFPKHFYEKNAPSVWNEKFIGTGPYALETLDKRHYVLLRQNSNWWGRKDPILKNAHNFPELAIRFVSEPLVAFQMILAGDLDEYAVSNSHDLEILKAMPEFGKKIRLVEDTSFGGSRLWSIDLNLKNPLFADREVRRALNMLWNREFVNHKFFANSLRLSDAKWPRTEPFYQKPKAISYDPKGALDILHKAGWMDPDSKGVLSQTIDGKKAEFAFAIKYEQHELEPMLTSFVQDAAKIGIKVTLEYTDPTLMWKLMKEGQYDASADVNFYNFGEILSDSYGTTGAYNTNGYSNRKVDKLFEQLNAEFNQAKRKTLKQKLFQRINDDITNIRGFELNKRYFAVSDRVEIPKDPKFKKQKFWRLKSEN